jgi:hypothetical protein
VEKSVLTRQPSGQAMRIKESTEEARVEEPGGGEGDETASSLIQPRRLRMHSPHEHTKDGHNVEARQGTR